jgi:hypothetical protein
MNIGKALLLVDDNINTSPDVIPALSEDLGLTTLRISVAL